MTFYYNKKKKQNDLSVIQDLKEEMDKINYIQYNDKVLMLVMQPWFVKRYEQFC